MLETIEDEQETLGGGDFSLLQNRQSNIPKTGNTVVKAVRHTMDEGQEDEQVRKTWGWS